MPTMSVNEDISQAYKTYRLDAITALERASVTVAIATRNGSGKNDGGKSEGEGSRETHIIEMS